MNVNGVSAIKDPRLSRPIWEGLDGAPGLGGWELLTTEANRRLALPQSPEM